MSANESGALRYLGLTAAVALLYFAGAELGLSLASVHINVTPVWPPAGIALAALLLFGRRMWVAIFLGAFAANIWTGISIGTAFGIAFGNTTEALVAAFLLTRRKSFSKSLDTLPAVLLFVLYAVVISPIISATIGTLSLSLGGAAQWGSFGRLWLTWWLGDGFGTLVVAPFLLALGSMYRPVSSVRSLAEGGLLLILLFAVSMSIFGGWFPGRVKDYPLEHLCLPFLIWAGLRFDRRVVTTATILLAGVALWGTAQGHGPFVHGTPNESLLLLQAFVGASTLMALVLFAAMSERQKAESEKLRLAAQVRMHRQRVEDVVAHVPGVVWEAWGEPDAANQRIDFVSSYVETMFGYSEDEWLSTPNFWLAIVHPDDKERAAREAAAIFSSRNGGIIRFRCLTKDGREVWVQAQSVVVCDENGRPVGMRGVTMDVTPAVQAEHERAQLLRRESDLRNQAEKAIRLRDEFLATLSHELRTPLNAIVGWSRLLRSGELDEEAASHAVDVIQRNAWSQKRIIEDMLDVSRIITGKLRIRLLPTQLLPVVQASIDVVRDAAEAKQISITTDVEAQDLFVSGDAERLQQIAWNILSNAIKFTTPGGLVEVSMRRRDEHAEIAVSDTGPGISPEFLPHIFERFSQEDGSSTRTHGGLGLGLAIVRHLVELHGGSVEARNKDEGNGAILTVKLPAL